jgi:hypothetical protein
MVVDFVFGHVVWHCAVLCSSPFRKFLVGAILLFRCSPSAKWDSIAIVCRRCLRVWGLIFEKLLSVCLSSSTGLKNGCRALARGRRTRQPFYELINLLSESLCLHLKASLAAAGGFPCHRHFGRLVN